MLTGSLVKDFHVEGFWPAFFGGLLISIISGILNVFFGPGERRAEAHVHTQGSPPPRDQRKDLGDGPVIDV
jgi:hypothetical protein